VALLHEASLTPSKLELLRQWLPGQSWADGTDTAAVEVAGAYRFDDPAGDVGIETFLLVAPDGTVLQVPLTYRSAPVADLDAALLGTTEHSVLGTRWVYDGCADPVYAAALVDTIVSGGTQADLEVLRADGRRETRSSPTHVRGTGDAPLPDRSLTSTTTDGLATRMTCGAATVILFRRPADAVPDADASAALDGTWPGSETSTPLAVLHRG
jgi:Maltokinase N-terminal cap domain